jgi:hypothetical protein
MVDGLTAALWFTTLLSSLGTRDPASVAAIVARVVVGAMAVIGGWLFVQRRPPGGVLAVTAAVATAALVTVGTVWRLLPTNLDPSLRVPVATAYWVAALVVAVVATRAQRRMPDGDLE